MLQAFNDGGEDAANALLESVVRQLRDVMLLCGARTLADLKRAPRVIIGELRDWLQA